MNNFSQKLLEMACLLNVGHKHSAQHSAGLSLIISNRYLLLLNVLNVKQCLRARKGKNSEKRDNIYAHTRTRGHSNIQHIQQTLQRPVIASLFLLNVKIAHSANIQQAQKRGVFPIGRCL